MKRLTLNLALSLLVGFIPYLTAAQNHFTPVWSGNPYLAMNVYVTQAQYNSADLVSGDEIGIFDGTYCVGAKVLTGPIVSGSYLAMIASTQDGTTTTNGFTPGHTITYRFWKASSSTEIQTITPTYSSGGPTFASLGSAAVSLSATSGPPTIIISTSLLSDFGSVQSGNSSASQSYTVSGSNLTANIVVTAPTGFQVSLNNSSFGTSVTLAQLGGTVPTTTVYARFSPSSGGAQSGNITHASSGAATVNVAVSGTGSTPTGVITVSTPSLPDFGSVQVGNSSASQSYTVSGSNLTANIVVTAPTGFQVSLTNGFFGTSMTLTQSGGTVPTTTVYARFSPSSSGAQSGNITHASSGATTQNAGVSGTGTTSTQVNVYDQIFQMRVYSAEGVNWTSLPRPYTRTSTGWATPIGLGSTTWGVFQRASATSGGVGLICIYAPTDSTNRATVAEYDVSSPLAISLKFGLKDGRSTNYANVRFVVEVEDSAGYTKILDSTLTDSPGWRTFQADLSRWNKSRATLRFITDPVGVTWEDWSEWAEVKIDVQSVLAVSEAKGAIAEDYCIFQNYPNPFNPSTKIKFELPRASHVNLSVFDILGREVSVLVNDRRDAGVYEVRFDGSNLASGVYFYRIQAGDYVATKKLLLMK